MKYKMPTKSDLKGRSSTMSNAFAISITPYIVPSEEEVKASYDLLQIQEGQCAYCLGEGNDRSAALPQWKSGNNSFKAGNGQYRVVTVLRRNL